MKKYTVSRWRLGIIARKFGMRLGSTLPLNKEKIGDNQDLLKEGTVLDMPSIDTSSGEDKIKQKTPIVWIHGGAYTGIVVALSVSITDSKGEKLISILKGQGFGDLRARKGTVLHKGTYKRPMILGCYCHMSIRQYWYSRDAIFNCRIMHFHPDDIRRVIKWVIRPAL